MFYIKCNKIFSPKPDIMQENISDKIYRVLREKNIDNIEF